MTEDNNKEHKVTGWWVKYVEYAMIFVGLMGSVATIPQIIRVWLTHPHHALSLSLITWTAYLVICILWIIYGLAFKRFAIVFTNLTYAIADACMVAGIVYHSGWHF